MKPMKRKPKLTEDCLQRAFELENVFNGYNTFLKQDICEERETGVCVLGTNIVPEAEWQKDLPYYELQYSNIF